MGTTANIAAWCGALLVASSIAQGNAITNPEACCCNAAGTVSDSRGVNDVTVTPQGGWAARPDAGRPPGPPQIDLTGALFPVRGTTGDAAHASPGRGIWRVLCNCGAGRPSPIDCLDGCSWPGLDADVETPPPGWRTLVAVNLQTAITNRLYSHAWAPGHDYYWESDPVEAETASRPGQSGTATGITHTISFHLRDRAASEGHTVDAAKPEPATVALAGLGGAFILRRQRR
ncbi:MAG TPA: PEP-CTERM sorting domain-containing protein [Phycisphaerae bacterium]|nr:PEP-CTERM sorting domain-containing protein [Phycisphaerae bacterium]